MACRYEIARLVAGGWWLVAGEVVDLTYPALRELGRFAVEDPISKVAEGAITFRAVSWGEDFPCAGLILFVVFV